MKKIIYILIAVTFLSIGCEDPIDVDLREDKKELVIDAFITNDSGEQKVILTRTIGYFEPRGTNPPVTGAGVGMLDADSLLYIFAESATEPGTYVYPKGEDFNRIGEQYGLVVITGVDTFVSISTMAQSPAIDSITWRIEDSTTFNEEYYEAEFHAKDLVGVGNTYFIRSYKNDTLLNEGDQATIAYDAGFSPGSDLDGIEFIVPIRRFGINDYDNNFDSGDLVRVDLIGVSNEFYLFLNLATQQINNGGLFATPPSNVPSNFVNRSSVSENKANGFFVIGQINKKTRRIIE